MVLDRTFLDSLTVKHNDSGEDEADRRCVDTGHHRLDEGLRGG